MKNIWLILHKTFHLRLISLDVCKKCCLVRQMGYSNKIVNVGEKVTIEKVITEKDLQLFKEITNDWNPLHFQKDKPAIVHGALLNGLVSAALGTKLPGPGTVLVAETLKFPNPCYVGEKVKVTVEITSVRKIMECSFTCSVEEKIVLLGNAKVVFKEQFSCIG